MNFSGGLCALMIQKSSGCGKKKLFYTEQLLQQIL